MKRTEFIDVIRSEKIENIKGQNSKVSMENRAEPFLPFASWRNLI